jgi:hypothetical protein
MQEARFRGRRRGIVGGGVQVVAAEVLPDLVLINVDPGIHGFGGHSRGFRGSAARAAGVRGSVAIGTTLRGNSISLRTNLRGSRHVSGWASLHHQSRRSVEECRAVTQVADMVGVRRSEPPLRCS